MFSLLLLNENQNRSNYNYYIYETICCGILIYWSRNILINECCVNQDYEDNNELVIISGRQKTHGYVDDVIINAYILLWVIL
jgi:hypothetical protein